MKIQIKDIVYAEYNHKVIKIIDEYHIKIDKNIDWRRYGDIFTIGNNYGKIILIGNDFYELESINELDDNKSYKVSGQIMITNSTTKEIGKFVDIKIGDIVKSY